MPLLASNSLPTVKTKATDRPLLQSAEGKITCIANELKHPEFCIVLPPTACQDHFEYLKQSLSKNRWGSEERHRVLKYVVIPLSHYGMQPVGWMHWLFYSHQCVDLKYDLGVDLMKSGDNLLIADSRPLRSQYDGDR